MENTNESAVERQKMDVDIACVGFGPAMGGFLHTLTRKMVKEDGTPLVESHVQPGCPPQVLCYERADDLGFGVSGVVTKARGIKSSFPDFNPEQVPMAANVGEERILYLLDPIGASRRSATLRLADKCIKLLGGILPFKDHALNLPFTPSFLHKTGGFVLSIGQFNQWVASQVMGTGLVQIWPGTPVAQVLSEKQQVKGIRLADQGTDKQGNPEAGFMPGMDIQAALTVIGDGPVGAIGQQIDQIAGLPPGRHQYEWAVGMKMVIDLPAETDLKPGTVFHTFGFPEPEIFGFLYVHPERVASLGIFVPSWFDNPIRTSYRYLQHWMMHPYLWKYLKGGRLRSWGAKTLQESGLQGEPYLVGNGYARIGEGSGSTNVLTGSGFDEAWTTGVQLAESVLQLLQEKKSFTRENLEATYVKRRRESWVETEGRIAEKSRDGFQRGVVAGLIGMGLTGITRGLINLPGKPAPPHRRIPSMEDYFRGKLSAEEIAQIRQDCYAQGISLHSALMDKCGWPSIPYDGQLLVTHQDALLMGGKVQAPPGYADHVVFLYPNLCQKCGTKICIEICSGQAITPGAEGVPAFDREKCIHCGACLWNCAQALPGEKDRTNLLFRAGAGGLHSAEN